MVGGGSFLPLFPMERAHVRSISPERIELERWDWSRFKALGALDTYLRQLDKNSMKRGRGVAHEVHQNGPKWTKIVTIA